MTPSSASPISSLASREPLTALRRRSLRGLLDHLSPQDHAAVRTCADRLHALLRDTPDRAGPGRGTVMVGYGGGKDSTYTLAFVRAVQLAVAERHGRPFVLRTATNRHSGMPRAVMENIDRAYAALGMRDDPACELLLIDGDAVQPFDVDAPQPAHVAARNRDDILMTGHRTGAEARPTFCNACNLSMANAFGVASAHDGGVDIVITGDSKEEQRAYAVWISRLSRQVRGRAAGPGRPGFPRLLGALDGVARAYFADIHGPHAHDAVAQRAVRTDVPSRLRFFSIYGETAYDAGSHWDLLVGHLGFVFDDLAFSFTESDCANPALMAHLRGLRCQYVFGRGYEEGLAEYVGFALRLMRRKEFPQHLIDEMAARYAAPGAPERMRSRVNDFARRAYGLDEDQLICMVHSPFTGRGAHLGDFLRGFLSSRDPGLAGQEAAIRALLAGDGPGDRELRCAVERLSGLDLGQLRVLYRSEPMGPASAAGSAPTLLDSVLADDPHQDRIRTRHSPDGPEITETISGR